MNLQDDQEVNSKNNSNTAIETPAEPAAIDLAAPVTPIDFLRQWEPGGFWVLTAIEPDSPGIVTRTFSATTADKAEAWVWRMNQQERRNIYFSVNRPQKALTSKAAKSDIAELVCRHVDIDVPGAWSDEEGERILGKIRALPDAPTVTVYSGGGIQCYWKFTAPITADAGTIKAVETANKRIAEQVGGDHCHDVARIMRLPGTINFPDRKKRERGRTVALATVLEAKWSRLYDLPKPEGLCAADAEPNSAAASHEDAEAAADTTENAQKAIGLDWDTRLERLPEWCQKTILTGKTTNSENKRDRSRAVFAVCCELVRCGWTDDDIAKLLLDRSLAISAHVYAQAKPRVYARRQAQQAREKTANDWECDGKGRILKDNQVNIRRALDRLGVMVSHDTFADRLLIEGPYGEPQRFMGDAEIAALWLIVDQKCGFRPTKNFFFDVVVDTARANAFHPVRDYLDGLQWDGKEPIDRWLIDYAGAKDTEYVRAVSRLPLVASVRRIRQPAAKFDELLILEGLVQGTDKSSAPKCSRSTRDGSAIVCRSMLTRRRSLNT